MDNENEKILEQILERIGYVPTNFGGKYCVSTKEALEIAVDLTSEYYKNKYGRSENIS